MAIRKTLTVVLCLFILLRASAQQASAEMNKVRLQFSLDAAGSPSYEVLYNSKPLILPSILGFSLDDDSAFYQNFRVTGTEKRSVDETWQPVWGETQYIRNHYNELTVHLQQVAGLQRKLDIIFRVFEEGVAFRYV